MLPLWSKVKMRFLIVLALCLAAVAAVPQHPQRIVGGSVTTIDQYPSIVALLYSWNGVSYWQSCGGTILNQRSILTAAHCTIGDSPNNWRARAGSSYASSGGTTYNMQQLINHPSYDSWTMDSDVSIMRTSTNIVFSNFASAGFIAAANYNLADNQVVWAAGWGTTTQGGQLSEQLRHVQIWSINQNTCAQRYATFGWPITATMLCSGWLDVGGRDQCQGDSGGPLYHNGVVVGVCSWGYGCAHAVYPGVNARVSSFTAWITANA